MRLIVSMSVPPRSLAPACRSLAAPAGPEFHLYETWMFAIAPSSINRAMAVTRMSSRKVDPVWLCREAQRARSDARTAVRRIR